MSGIELSSFGIFTLVMIVGAVLAFLFGFLASRYIKKKIEPWLKEKTPEDAIYYIKLLNLLVLVFQAIIILFFFSISARLLNIEIVVYLLDRILNIARSIIIAIIVAIIGFTLAKIVSIKVSNLNFGPNPEYSVLISIFAEFIVLYATVLTILEHFNIKATPFFEIFRMLLYMLGAIIALIIGIPIGLSIKKEIDKKQKRK